MKAWYFTITGRRIELGALAPAERRFLTTALGRVRAGAGWTRFGAWWIKAIEEEGIEEGSPAQRICEDLEARLGIAEGKVAPPDHRDYLADLIEERYGSRYRFCAETGIDQGQLSRFFAGKSGLSVELLAKASEALGAKLVVWSDEQLRESFSRERAVEALEEVAG